MTLSNPIKANTLFGDGTRSDNSRCEIETFRHLSNIRYMDTAAAFAVTARSLDWTSDSVKIYGTAARGAFRSPPARISASRVSLRCAAIRHWTAQAVC